MRVSKLDYTKVKKVNDIIDINESKKGQFYLFLDQITDPQNFGSILRTAMFIGVDAVIVNSKNSCGLTPTVSKVSSGALEFIPLYNVRFVSKFLEDAQTGFHNFKVISTDIQSSNEDMADSTPIKEPEPVIEDDSEDERELAKMFGIQPESKMLKEIKKEMSQKAAQELIEQPSESEGEDNSNDSKPFKAPQVISLDDLKL